MDTKYNLQEKGGVYVINNKTIVNPETKQPLTKIGRSGKENPKERIISMNKETPVPQDFEIEGIIKTPTNKILENMPHKYLEDEHYKKEYYTADTKTSLSIVAAIDENIKKHSYCLPDKNYPVSGIRALRKKKKRIILFTVIYCLIFLRAFTQTNEEFLMLYKNKNIKEITVTKRNLNEQEKSITVKLNENQKSEFLNRLNHAKKEKYIKIPLFLYKAEICYIDDKTEEIWLNGRVIKKEDGTTYKLENNLQLFINSLFSKEETSKLYKEKIIRTENRNIHVYQANYSRNDLIFISGITSDINSPKTYDCTWKIGQELLDVQNSFLKKKYLKDYIKNEKLQELADLYIKDVYNPSWKNEIPLFYSHYELYPLDEQNNKWIIYFIYVTKEHENSKKYWDEVVFMMPDGTIIISENNAEEIKFKE